MAKQTNSDGQLHKVTEGSFLFCSPQGNVLFGCPPEILKRIMVRHLPMPDTVVLPEMLNHFHSSQASLEFPLYHFLFVQRGLDRGRKYQVVARPAQCEGLTELLRVTVVGPSEKEMVKSGLPASIAKEIAQETRYMSLKNPKNEGKPYTIPEMITFFPVSTGERCELYPVREGLAAVVLERKGPALFRLLYGEEAFDIDMTVTEEQTPNYPIKHKKMNTNTGRFTLTVLGRSNGFDPNDPANGYILNIDGKIVLWDCPAYLHQHLKKLGVAPKDIDAFVLSHVHEDHIDITESLRTPPFELYTTPEIYYSLLIKLSAVFGCSTEEAKKFHNWHPVDITNPAMEICGAHFEFFHSVHAIPALGARIQKTVAGKKGLLHITGDHLSAQALATMHKAKGLSDRRYKQASTALTGEETLVLVDAGGGAIHGDYRDYLDKKGRIVFMHTGLINEDLPENMQLVDSAQVLDILR